MHHYSTSAYISCVGLRASSETVGLWQKFLPREAFKHDFLLNGILAFTALHIAKITRQPKGQIEGDKPALFSSSSSYYFQKALEYQNLAFGSFHGVLQNVTPENCHAAFGFSVLTMLFAIAIPGVEDGANQDPTSTKPDSIQSIFTLFEYLKGLASIIGISKDWLNAGPFRHVLNRHDEYTSGDWRISNTDVAQALRQLTLVNDELNNAASGADSGTTETSSSTHATNQRAISHLEFCFAKQEIPSTDPATATDEAQAAAVVGDIDRGHIIGWLGVAGSPFVARLREGDPLSLLIFAHWAILLDDLQQFWWSENSGKVLVAEIAGVLHARGPEWEERTRWARRKVGLL